LTASERGRSPAYDVGVEYEVLPVVTNPHEAMRFGAPILHPEYRTYRRGLKLPNIPNLQAWTVLGKGNVAEGFVQADRVFEHTFSLSSGCTRPIWRRACVVQIGETARSPSGVAAKCRSRCATRWRRCLTCRKRR
jgi:CO/xanthine dehydrogenase Mo-binding subunit